MTTLAPARHAARPGGTTRRAALRVALVSDWFLPRRGGIELQLAGLAAQLTAAGHRVDVLTPTPGDVTGDAVEASVVRLDVPRLPGVGVAYTPALGRALTAALARGAYDVVHAHASVASPAAFAAVRAAQRLRVPCVVSFHSVLDAPVRLLGGAALSGWARDSGVVLAGVSALVAGQLRRVFPEAQIRVLPNGSDLAWWRAPADSAELSDAALSGAALSGAASGGAASGGAGADGAEPAGGVAPARAEAGRAEVRVATAMRLVRKKRPLALVRVAAAMRAAAAPAGVRVRLLVAGEGRERGRLEHATRRAGLDDVLTVLGWQSRAELRTLYRTAAAFVLPTARESFGIAALEARAAGLPVLARAGSGVADFVTSGVDGWLVASDAELAAHAAAWVRDPAALAAMGRASAAAAPIAFGWDAVIASHLDAYAAAAG